LENLSNDFDFELRKETNILVIAWLEMNCYNCFFDVQMNKLEKLKIHIEDFGSFPLPFRNLGKVIAFLNNKIFTWNKWTAKTVIRWRSS
jgi:hypothetical protein